MFKEEKGITLVALVITIIVLLILAGVSIALVVGNNGILGRATGAVETSELATAEQEIKIAIADAQMAAYTASATSPDFKTHYINKDYYDKNCTSGTVSQPTYDDATEKVTLEYTAKKSETVYTATFSVAAPQDLKVEKKTV